MRGESLPVRSGKPYASLSHTDANSLRPCTQYAFASQVISRGLDPTTTIIELAPRPGEFTLREEDILSTIEKEGSSIALVLFAGVQYYTGQWFPMKKITKAAKAKVNDHFHTAQGFMGHIMLLGLHLRLGPCTCRR